MTKKTNRRFLMMGAGAVLLTLLAAQVHQQTGSEVAYSLVGAFMFAAFIFVAVLGIAPWAGMFGLKYPIQNTKGFRADYAAEPEKEVGPYASQGWRQRMERVGLRNTKAFGLYIEPDEKS
ncbi:hypothetical protein LB566_08200 [Mesorhizobium sp. CA13]|uniref:hypothetical protein n=1 Tax=Mesorhizobium sp. CA13 TaxID=2876643 RepID=UPI001CC9D8CD|nr:hypothetical protein [Mesorhizobium sp. CA13]MBZ9853777.1 hypothetical protein [Mesorhizobium sp. CA13]